MNGPSAWWAEPSRPKREPSMFPGRMIETQLTIEILTDRLADEAGGKWYAPTDSDSEVDQFAAGYYAALNNLRQLVNVPPINERLF